MLGSHFTTKIVIFRLIWPTLATEIGDNGSNQMNLKIGFDYTGNRIATFIISQNGFGGK